MTVRSRSAGVAGVLTGSMNPGVLRRPVRRWERRWRADGWRSNARVVASP